MFKGSGFYETDYRSDSYKKAAKADKESSKPKDKKTDTKKKSETKKGSTSPKKTD